MPTNPEEPWDELMGPPPVGTNSTSAPPPQSAPPIRRAGSTGAPPPSMVFHHHRSSSTGSGRSSSSGAALPQRWSQHEPSGTEAANATANAVYMASSAAANRADQRHSSNSSVASRNSAFEDDDMQNAAARDPYIKEFEIGSSADEDDDEEAIGRDYDSQHHDSIRQEALRMLEVAEADPNYSVHRTITGGFAAQARSLGKARPKALSGLSFTATRISSSSQRYSAFGAAAAAAADTSQSYYDDDDDDNGVVDVIGMEKRALSNAEASSTGNSKNWSSRYSIDNTLLAMTGGAMKMDHSVSKSDAGNMSDERFSARNLFASSPVKSPQIFGSGFSFRQQHVFGKQGVSANLQQSWADAGPLEGTLSSNGNKLKTWQEQLLHKKRQQRRLLFCLCAGLLCIILPLATVVGRQEKTLASLPADGTNGSVTFYVTADVPYNAAEEVKLVHDLAAIVPTTSFAVHLGNIQDAKVNLCESSHYSHVADLLEMHSPKTVFVVPGQEDWNNCPDPEKAFSDWSDQFQFFNERWDSTGSDKDFDVFTMKNQIENWSFVFRHVLFLGVHTVNGPVHDQTESDTRNNNNYEWVRVMAKVQKDQIRSVVVFGNAKPGYPGSVRFFAQLEEFMRDFDLPVMYVHAASGTGAIKEYKPFNDTPNFYAVQVETGTERPPLRMNVGFGDSPFLIG